MKMKHLGRVFVVLAAIGVGATSASAQPIAAFIENEADANGFYQWNNPNNWSTGSVPDSTYTVRIGSGSDTAVAARLESGSAAVIWRLRIDKSVDGPSDLTIKSNSVTTTVQIEINYGSTVGTSTITAIDSTINGGSRLNIGQSGVGKPGALDMTGGTLDITTGMYIGTAGATGKGEGSSATLSGVVASVGGLIEVGSSDANDPGLLKLTGTGSLSATGDDTGIYVATFEINGGSQTIGLQDFLLQSGSDSVLKLSGSGVSTISAVTATFSNGSILNVDDLSVAEATYKVVDATGSITDNGLAFAPGTDPNMWSFEVDDTNNDLLLTYGEAPPETYTLTVNFGTGDGDYQASTVVDITADPPPDGNQMFDVWTGDTANIADTSEPNTTITMPAANTEITATYKLIDTYTLTVNSGSGDGQYEASTVVDILADDPPVGDIFDVWTGDTAYVDNVNEPNTTVTMPAANVTVTATYVDDPNTFSLTVNSGAGDGIYDPDAVVDILANDPPPAKIFDVWTGDTAGVDNVNEPNTTYTMPAADSEITATYEDDPNYVPPPRGYSARACGFDMNHNGVIGEPADATVGDGNTTDPDGDGTDEDLIYVDATSGNDNTGDGSAGSPYQTVGKALSVADGPGDGAEDIVCIAGVFEEWLTLTQSGVAGYYTRDNFQFPNNPFMLIGWDTDGDGEYPPYDTDDEAIFDGNSGIAWAISNYDNKRYIEIAHISAREYRVGDDSTRGCGFMEIARHGGEALISHLYVHDVEMENINYHSMPGGVSGSRTIVFKFWVGSATVTHVAVINNLVDGMGHFLTRGTPHNGSGNFRFQNLTIKGKQRDPDTIALSLFKLWDEHSNVEYLDNILDSQVATYGPYGQGPHGYMIRPCVRNYTVRNNEVLEFSSPIGVTGYSAGYCNTRTSKDHVIDRNIVRTTWTGFTGYVSCFYIEEGGTLATETQENVTITNNFFSTTHTTGNTRGILSYAGNDGGTQPGTIKIAGNTIYGPGSGDLFRGISIYSTQTYPQEDYVVKNNIIANVEAGNRNMSVTYAPSGWIANGNIYDDDGNYVWNNLWYGTLADWQTASGQDANSRTGDPLFVDAANGDFHIHPNDTLVEGAGVDITSITTVDFDGDARSASTPWPGADVGVEANVPNQAPTANDDSYETDINTELNVSEANGVLDNDSDPESDPLTAILVTDVSNGTLTLYSSGAFDYIPDANYTGEDMFVYKANDSTADSGDANVVITVSAPTDDYASAESTDRGTVDGNYTDTYSSDDSYEALTEVVQANRSKLEHEWTFSVTGGTSVQFSVEAYKAGTEDDFKFEYSPNGSDWTYMLTVSKTSDDNTPQTFDLPGGTSGTFYIHVLDTNRDNKAKDLDTVYVDHMFIRSQ